MSDYPIPSYAAYIWIVGDQIWVGFPPLADHIQSHNVPFPATEKGMALLVKTLRERSQGSLAIGLRGSPTKHQVEIDLKKDKRYNEILKAMNETKEQKAAGDRAVEEFLAELGL